ncbi:hypothetical protein V7I42_00065 [Raoultella ornithinolytica]|uniref:hypothetical protein n=1 Tax=Raoultella ornithinolytica TaxID=54291 RepID=UPI002FF26BC6
MTDITELAQREKFEAWVMTQICISKSTLEGLRTTDGYRNSTLSGTDYNRLWSLYQSATAELVEALEKAQQVDEELCRLLPPGAEYMDPPDGGDVTPLEGVRRMVADYRQSIDVLESQLKTAENNEIDARCHIADLESHTVKLPKPHAHLIWIQAGHAPDDYWDDIAVSHSEKDRCCDGSERYPVYARWEIEEALSAAGINWEAE